METMRLWVLAFWGCVGCATNGAKPSVSPRSEAAVAQSSEAERRPYAELMPPPREGAASPGVWLEIASPAQLLSKLPDAIQSKPGFQAIKDVTKLATEALGADVGAIVDLSQPVEL